MECKVLATGSRGNAVLLNNSILIDCGIPYSLLREYEKDLEYIFLTHQHKDHLNLATIKRIVFNRPTIRIIAGEHLANELKTIPARNLFFTKMWGKYKIGKFRFRAVPLIHDVTNVGWDFDINGYKAIYATDTARISHIEAKGYNLYLIEGNYKIAEIAQRMKDKDIIGQYSYERRVLQTHLSVEQAEKWLLDNASENSEYIFLHGHEDKEKI